MSTMTWKSITRVLLKTAVLFLLLNALFAWLRPLETLGHLSLYNWLLPGRLRLPYGENPAESYNLSLYNVPAMLASHTVSRPKAADEFRVLLIGDSATWGWFLENGDTLAGQLNKMHLQTADGRFVRVYNLGYPVLALSKDVLLLDAAMQTDPDLILWPVTLDSFPRDKQIFPPLVQNNPQRMQQLIRAYDLELDVDDGRFVTPSLLDRTIVGQRRSLADLLRLQQAGFAWAATGIDQVIPQQIELRRSDFAADESWGSFTEPAALTDKDLAFDVLAAGMTIAADVPVLLINEPMFISQGQNSDLRYNSFYPRWAYDQYRALLADTAVTHNWPYLDLWDTIPPDEFSDTPVHLTAAGNNLLAQRVAEGIRPFLAEKGN
ncbi:MAG: SGNH/GDSL hydrolase family protein [Ardenticatenaceae bacterium]|nr:SGNH/GDSL hydrolase family protein [Ardenticatenaceae bacterium]